MLCCKWSTRINPSVSIHQLRLNGLSFTASCQALIGQTESPTGPHCGNGDKTAKHLLLLCPNWAAERQRYFGDSIDITDVFQDYESLVEFLISSGHLSPHIGSAWRARHDNNNNNNQSSGSCHHVSCWDYEAASKRHALTVNQTRLTYREAVAADTRFLHTLRSTILAHIKTVLTLAAVFTSTRLTLATSDSASTCPLTNPYLCLVHLRSSASSYHSGLATFHRLDTNI